MTEPACTCTELQRMTACHDFRNEPHVIGCPRWGTLKADWRYPCYCLPGEARCDDPYRWCDRATP